jgi:predicted RecB family nuclease
MLLDHRDAVATEQRVSGYGDKNDDRAISHLVGRLRVTPSFCNTDVDKVTDVAVDLYAQLCREVETGATDERVTKIAELLGEKPEDLRARLTA